MPDRSWPVFLWLKEIKKLRGERHWLAPAPVYAATVMVLAAALLLLAVVSGGEDSSREARDSKRARPAPVVEAGRQEAPAAAAAVTAPNQNEPAAQVIIPSTPVRPAPRPDDIPQRPVAGEVALGFGWQPHPVFHDWRYHTGVDIKVPENDPVRAMYSGEVNAVYQDKTSGLTVVVNSGAYSVYYGALATTILTKGQQIEAGARIGTVGSSPGEPFYHLHLAIKNDGKYINPEELLSKAR
jgi:murein DD-endopeptidase MepM/ murein hydrolase activator NlpD